MSVSRRTLLTLVPVAWAGSITAATAASKTKMHTKAKTKTKTLRFSVTLTGAQQVPPVKTSGSGMANMAYDPATREVTWSISFAGLSSPVTMAHIHGPAAQGANAGVEVWLSKKGVPPTSPFSGSAKLTPAEAKQLLAGQTYINIHTKNHPTGEIRGQIVVPKA